MISVVVPSWTHWLVDPPPAGVLIKVSRDEWREAMVCTRDEAIRQPDVQGPVNGVAAILPGVFWKLTGIGREQLARREAQHAVSF